MFDFTTTTIVNKSTDIKGTTSKLISLNHGVNLKVDQIKKVLYTGGVTAVPASVAVTVPSMATGITEDTVFRLAIELRLRGSNNPLYANDTIFKGKPLYFEALVNKSSSEINTTIATNITNTFKNNTLNLAKFDGKNIIDISNSTNTINITTDSEFIVFHKVTLEQYIPTSIDVATNTTQEGRFEEVAGTNVKYTKGNLGFGTYEHLQRDVQLPTDANIRFKRLYEDEVIVPGAPYHQYIFEMEAPRNFTGQGAVGQTITSLTRHVVWVADSVNSNFKNGLTNTANLSITTVTFPV